MAQHLFVLVDLLAQVQDFGDHVSLAASKLAIRQLSENVPITTDKYNHINV
jgi:hypothetical protein